MLMMVPRAAPRSAAVPPALHQNFLGLNWPLSGSGHSPALLPFTPTLSRGLSLQPTQMLPHAQTALHERLLYQDLLQFFLPLLLLLEQLLQEAAERPALLHDRLLQQESSGSHIPTLLPPCPLPSRAPARPKPVPVAVESLSPTARILS